jgi:hypothetical protein
MSGYGLMKYVVCSGCGDPVGGRIPSGNEPRVLICVHCHVKTAFEDADLRQGLVGYDEATKRWRVATLADSLRHQEPVAPRGRRRRLVR